MIEDNTEINDTPERVESPEFVTDEHMAQPKVAPKPSVMRGLGYLSAGRGTNTRPDAGMPTPDIPRPQHVQVQPIDVRAY